MKPSKMSQRVKLARLLTAAVSEMEQRIEAAPSVKRFALPATVDQSFPAQRRLIPRRPGENRAEHRKRVHAAVKDLG